MLNGVVSLIVLSCEDHVTCRVDDVASYFTFLGLEVQSRLRLVISMCNSRPVLECIQVFTSHSKIFHIRKGTIQFVR